MGLNEVKMENLTILTYKELVKEKELSTKDKELLLNAHQIIGLQVPTITTSALTLINCINVFKNILLFNKEILPKIEILYNKLNKEKAT